MKRERSARSHGALIGLLAAVAIFVVPISSPAAEEEVRTLLRELWIQMPAREAGAPLFSLPDANGAPVRLADFKGRPLMLYFWTTY